MNRNVLKVLLVLLVLLFSLNAHASYLGVANSSKISPDFSEFESSGKTAYHYGYGITAGGKVVYSVGLYDASWNLSNLYVKAYNLDGSTAWTYDASTLMGSRATNYQGSYVQTLSNGNILVS